MKKVLRELLSQTRRLGGIVVPPMLQLAEPGRGYHCGGSMPMRAQPGKFESDMLGRPHGWSRVHAVDASVLPSVPGDDDHFFRHGQRPPHRLGNGGAVTFMSDKKICAITGSNGYVGGCVKNYFAARGWEILELTRQPKAGSRAREISTWRGNFPGDRSRAWTRSCIAPTISSRCAGTKSAR